MWIVVSGLVNCCVLQQFPLPHPFPPRCAFNHCMLWSQSKQLKPHIIRRRPSEEAKSHTYISKSRICYSSRQRNSGHRQGAAAIKVVDLTARAVCDGDGGDAGGEGESGPGGRGAKCQSRWLNAFYQPEAALFVAMARCRSRNKAAGTERRDAVVMEGECVWWWTWRWPRGGGGRPWW